LEKGREAFSRRAWTAAYTELAAADRDRALGPADLERLAVTAYLTGNDDESADAWARGYRAYADVGDVNSAALCAFHLGMGFMNGGEMARAGGCSTSPGSTASRGDICSCPTRYAASWPARRRSRMTGSAGSPRWPTA
jgi:hypothetical protein